MDSLLVLLVVHPPGSTFCSLADNPKGAGKIGISKEIILLVNPEF